MKNCSLREALTLEKLSWRAVSHGRDPTLEQGQSVRSRPTKEKGEADTTCNELTAAAVGEDMEKIRSEVWPAIKGGLKGRCFKILLYFLIILL